MNLVKTVTYFLSLLWVFENTIIVQIEVLGDKLNFFESWMEDSVVSIK